MIAGQQGHTAMPHRLRRSSTLAATGFLVLAMLGLAVAAPALHAQVNPFGRSPGGLTTEQQTAMGKAIEEVLGEDKVGASATWSADGDGGTVSIEKLYQRDGMSCALLKHAFKVDEQNTYQLPFCKTDKGWKVFF